MTEIKTKILQHFYTRKNRFIINKPILTIFQDNDRFDITGEYKDNHTRFKVEHGVATIYFSDIDGVSEFIEKHKEK